MVQYKQYLSGLLAPSSVNRALSAAAERAFYEAIGEDPPE